MTYMPHSSVPEPSTLALHPKAQRIRLGGRETAVFRYGSELSPTILAVHGFRGTHFGLELVATELAHDGYSVLVPDLPGCGDSQPLAAAHTANNLGRWLMQLWSACEEPPVVLGHSFGSTVVSAALAHGLDASRVILLSPIASPPLQVASKVGSALARSYYALATNLPTDMGRRLLASRAVAAVSGRVMTKTRDVPLRKWIAKEHMRRADAFSSSRAVIETYGASTATTVRQFAAQIRQPTLIIGGKLDQICPLADQQSLAAQIPESTSCFLDGTGHLLPYETPGQIARRIHNWISAQTPPVGSAAA